MRIRTKLTSFYLGIAMLFTVGGFYGISYTKNVGENFDQVESDSVPSLISLMEIIAATRQASIKAMEHSIRGREDDKIKALEALQKILDSSEVYKRSMLNQGPARSERLYEKIRIFSEIIRDYISLGSLPHQSLHVIKNNASINDIHNMELELHTTRRDLIHTLYPLIEREKQEFFSAAEQTRLLISNSFNILTITIIAVVLLVLVVGFILSRTITMHIHKLNDSAQYVANGNLNYKLNISSEDEIGELATSFEHMRKELIIYNNKMDDLVKERTFALENSNKELESYSYSISHDLRAPLRSIAGFSQILLEDVSEKLNDEEVSYLHKVINSSEYMEKLINDILELSRVSRSELQISDVNLSDICLDISNTLCESNPDRKVEWRIQPNLIVKGDYQLLHMAMTNLLGNAWKFTQKKSKAIIEFSCLDDDDDNQFSIRDNGIGFDMSFADKIFGLFQRLHRKDEYEGTGVGLATVQRIINRHKGRIKIEGEVGKGTIVYFSIPDK